MRLLLVLLILALPAYSAIAFVNAASAYDISNTTVSTSTVAVTAGNSVFIVVGYDAAGASCGATFTVTYTGGNTATQTGSNNSQPYSCVAQFRHVIPSSNGSTSFTVTVSSGVANLAISVLQFSGTDATTPLDQSAQGQATSGLNITSSSVTTTNANEVICVGGWNYYDGLTADTGYTVPTGGAASNRTAASYKIVSAIQTGITPKMTTSNAYGAVMVATFIEGTAPPARRRQPAVN